MASSGAGEVSDGGLRRLAVALLLGNAFPAPLLVVGAMGLGSLSKGLSLVLFIMGLRSVGSAPSGAYFSTAPFFGGLLAGAMGEQVTPLLVAAAVLMADAVWLHVSEHHTHERLVHDHWQVHDEYHQHAHAVPVKAGVRHRHLHVHEPITDEHAHFPDTHHRHRPL